MLANAQPKRRPHLLDKRASAAKLAEQDRKERALCKTRSGGRCEVREVIGRIALRCTRPGTENHHLIGGWGRRNRGRSLFACHRLQVCERCHEEITHHVLVPAVEKGLAECAATVRYERIRA